jgi:hypothetical protein
MHWHTIFLYYIIQTPPDHKLTKCSSLKEWAPQNKEPKMHQKYKSCAPLVPNRKLTVVFWVQGNSPDTFWENTETSQKISIWNTFFTEQRKWALVVPVCREATVVILTIWEPCLENMLLSCTWRHWEQLCKKSPGRFIPCTDQQNSSATNHISKRPICTYHYLGCLANSFCSMLPSC